MILETDDGLVVIQNSGFTGGQKNWSKKSKELADFLFLSETAIIRLFGQQNIESYVHFILGGGLQQIEIQQKVTV